MDHSQCGFRMSCMEATRVVPIASQFKRSCVGDTTVRAAEAFNCSCAALPCHSGDGFSCEQLCPLEECLNRDNPAISTCMLAVESSAPPHLRAVSYPSRPATCHCTLADGVATRCHAMHHSKAAVKNTHTRTTKLCAWLCLVCQSSPAMLCVDVCMCRPTIAPPFCFL
jgi:hypothetical protein